MGKNSKGHKAPRFTAPGTYSHPVQGLPPGTPNPLDETPKKLLFAMPYGTPISLANARKVLTAAEKEAQRRGWAMTIAVADSSGHLVAYSRMDGANLASVDIAPHKARVAVKYRRDTKTFEDAVQHRGMRYLLTLDDIIAARGGLPLVKAGRLIGAIGVSGGTGSQDELVAKMGAAALR